MSVNNAQDIDDNVDNAFEVILSLGGFSLNKSIVECALRVWVSYLGAPVGKLLSDGTWVYSDNRSGEIVDPFQRIRKAHPTVDVSVSESSPFSLRHIGGENTDWMFEGQYSREEARERLFAEKGFLINLIEHDQDLFGRLSSKQLQQSWWAERKLCNADRILGFPLPDGCGC